MNLKEVFMKPKEKTYKFKLYEEDLSDELLIQKIRNAISTLPVCCFSYVIVDLFDMDTKPGIPFFQTTHEREFKKTNLYTYEIRLNTKSDSKLIWKIYKKSNQTRNQVLNAFDKICLKRIFPDLSDWEESDICSENKNPADKSLKLLKAMDSHYWTIDLPTQIDDIIYLESLRYFVDKSDNYKGDKWILLAEQYCNNGQYEKAKEIYESVTFAQDATYWLAKMIMSGKLGKPNYKLAYEYYNHTCLLDVIYYFSAKIEIAKMHRDGKYFKANYRIYKKKIKNIEKEHIKDGGIYPYIDSLYYELALIEQTDGNNEQSISYCLRALHFSKIFLSYGDEEEYILNAKRILRLLYSLTEFNKADADFFDLIFIMDSPFRIIFAYDNTIYEIEGFVDKDKFLIKFNDKYYNGATKFLLKATLGGCRLLHEANKITIIEVQNEL